MTAIIHEWPIVLQGSHPALTRYVIKGQHLQNIPTDSVLLYGDIDTETDAQVFAYGGTNDDGTEAYYIQPNQHVYGSDHVLNTIATPPTPPRTEWTDYDYIPN